MTARKPIVLDNGAFEQIQSGDALNLNNQDIVNVKDVTWNQEYDNGNLGATFTIDWTKGNFQTGTLTSNLVLTVNSFPGVGRYSFRLVQNGSNAYTVTFAGTAYNASRWIGSSSAPSINTATAGETVILFIYDGTNATQGLGQINQPAGIVLSAGTQTVSTGTVGFVNANGFTWGMSNSSQITASANLGGVNTIGVSTLGNTSGTSGQASGSVLQYLFAGGNNITLSQSISSNSATITISAANSQVVMGMSDQGNTLGTTGVVSSQMVFVGGNNITLSQSTNGQSATLTISAGNNPLLSVWEPYQIGDFATGTSFSSDANNQPNFYPFVLPAAVSMSRLVFLISISTATGATASAAVGYTQRAAIYTRNALSTTRIDNLVSTSMTAIVSYSSSNSYGYSWNGTQSSSTNSLQGSIISGVKVVEIPFLTSLSAGEYWLLMLASSSSVGSANALAVSTLVGTNSTVGMGLVGALSNASLGPWQGGGTYTVTSGAVMATVGLSNINNFSNRRMYFNVINYNAS